MKILMITNNYTPYSGGVVSSIQALVQELQKLGHQITLVTLNFGYEPEDPPHVIRIFCPITFTYKKNPMAVPWRMQHALTNIMLEHTPDIVHVHHPFLLGVTALGVARKLHIPIIFTHHTLYEAYAHYVPFLPSLVRPITRSLVRNFCKKVTNVIVPSKSIKEYLSKQHIFNTHIAPSWLLPIFVQRTFTPRSIKYTNIKLLVVSRFMPEKNLYFLLDIMALLPENYTLTLIGFGAEFENLHAYAKHITQNRIFFILRPAREIIAQQYQNADIFVFASQTETQGLVLAEAMAAGLPVIALRGPGIVDIVQPYKNGIIVDTRQEMVSAIQTIVNNQDLYADLRAGAWCTSQAYWPENAIIPLLEIYKNSTRHK